MILVDTSIWIDHLRNRASHLSAVLNGGGVLMHPFILGELACGNLKRRSETLRDLAALPMAVKAQDDEVLQMIYSRQLWGKGLGWADAHLLASALLTHCQLWTRDQSLASAATEAGILRAL